MWTEAPIIGRIRLLPRALLGIALGFGLAPGTAAMDAQAADLLRMQVYQGGPQILPLIAEKQGFFGKNDLQVEFVPVATGPQAANALVSGSVDVGILAPANVAPLLAQNVHLTAVSGIQRMFVSLVGSKGMTTTWPESILQLKGKKIGVLALGAAGNIMCEEAILAAGLKKGDYTFVGTGTELGSGTAVEQGSTDAACINPQTRIPLQEKGYPVLFDFLHPSLPLVSYPASFQPDLSLSFVQLWTGADWATQNGPKIARMLKALAQAQVWMNDAANLEAVLKTVRGSIYDIPSFSDQRFAIYVKDMAKAHSLTFTPGDTETWQSIIKASMHVDLPPASQWLSPNAPNSDADVAALRN